jgi:hypothetical protein
METFIMKKLFLLFIGLSFTLTGCVVKSTKREVKRARQVYAHVKTATKTKDRKKATLEIALAFALASKGIHKTKPFGKSFFLFREGDTHGAATEFCRGLVRNKIKNPAMVLGAMTAITILGQKDKKDWRLFTRSMWTESKQCAKYYIKD